MSREEFEELSQEAVLAPKKKLTLEMENLFRAK